MNIFEELDLDKETVESAEEQTIRPAFELLPSGAYKAEIKELATFTTDSGAVQLKAVVYIPSEDREITIYQNVKKKNGEPNAIGQATFKHIVEATNTSMDDLTAKTETIEAYGKKVEGKVVKGLSGKPLIALVREVFEEGAKYDKYNDIEGYARTDGTNAKGENIVEVFNEKIAKNPILTRKAKNTQAKTNGSSDAGTAGKVADML